MRRYLSAPSRDQRLLPFHFLCLLSLRQSRSYHTELLNLIPTAPHWADPRTVGRSNGRKDADRLCMYRDTGTGLSDLPCPPVARGFETQKKPTPAAADEGKL